MEFQPLITNFAVPAALNTVRACASRPPACWPTQGTRSV